ncbi:MAG: phosphopantetheine-binding protein [Alphaproteobacteria bacterium]|nr:phosphopantetheine-binding protein [Alphaproteobacteria bacterium]
MTPLHHKIIAVIRSVLAAKQITVELPDDVILEMDLRNLELDSIDKLDLIMALEEAFDVVFDTSTVLKSASIAEIGMHVERARRIAPARS